ncbi:MAG: hypothetical protein FOGNACKC_01048 [Anaerolineae bacterium]|nr:hypothetical protein [Anaerolineae bacterium]
MRQNLVALNRKTWWPWLAIAAVLLAAALQLHAQGRLWICACRQIYLWVGDTWSSDNSQHIFDPYTFSHILHGVIFFWALAALAPRLPFLWRLSLATTIEAGWEMLENSAFVIDRYRAATASLAYQGDTVINSMSDIFACAIGFWLARYLGFRRSLIFFALTEIMMILWIRDSLLLNILMLIYPIEAIKTWQMGF